MLQQFKIDLKLHKGNFLVILLGELGGFLLGFLMVNLIMRLDEEPGDWFCLGALMALLVGVMCVLLMGGLGYSNEFQLALAMGRTRKAFMGAYALRLLLQILLGYIVVLAFYGLELAVNPLLYPGYENEVAFSFLTNWKILLPCGLGILILAMFIGAVYGRYGKKGWWAFYFIWLFCCFVLPRLFNDELGDSLLDRTALGVQAVFAAVPLTAWLILAILLMAGMAVTTVTLGKRQMVKL